MSEARTIQLRLAKARKEISETKVKSFCRLKLEGTVSQAMKFINYDNSMNGVHKLSKEVVDILTSKYSE